MSDLLWHLYVNKDENNMVLYSPILEHFEVSGKSGYINIVNECIDILLENGFIIKENNGPVLKFIPSLTPNSK